MFLENQGFGKMKVGQIPPSPPLKVFIINSLLSFTLFHLPEASSQHIANKLFILVYG
jgi:hypothetical protein